jgi:Cytochrome P460
MKKYLLLVCIIAPIICFQCKKKTTDDDTTIYKELNANINFTYYKNNNSILQSSPTSPHGGYMRVRFNSIAANALNASGKLDAGKTFPDGSLIVKEIYNSNSATDFKVYAVMKKTVGTNTASGYYWAEYNKDGSIAYSGTKKGSGCVSCHAQSGNSDLVRLFSLFP